MNRIFRPLHALRRFRRSERASMSVEAVLVFPILIFAYAGLFTFFDAFRTNNLNIRASYTIADMLSRENKCIDANYVDGLNKILSVLTHSDYPTILRASVVTYDEDLDDYLLVWSAVDGGSGQHIVPLTEGTMGEIKPYIPIMAHGDQNIVVETWSGFVPMMNFGLDAFYFENLVINRKRWAPQLKWDDGTDPSC